jgi:hypothetical protein
MRLHLIKLFAATPLLVMAFANPFGAVATDAAEASAKMDPCTLVTTAEARSILGVAVVAPVSSDDGLFRHCVYSSADKRNSLMLEAQTQDKAPFEQFMKIRGNPIPKLGSDAYANAEAVLVWKNGTQVNVTISDESGKMSDAQKESAREKAASLVLRRL